MRFGLCGKISQIDEAEKLGFEYLEVPLNGLAAMTEEEFNQACNQVNQAKIKVERCNLLFPKTLALLQLNEKQQMEMLDYLETAFSRMHRLGADIAVFGSGKSRNLPSFMSYREGFERLVAVTRKTADVAAKYGITIAIESLNHDETNMLNTLIEGEMLVSVVSKDNVKLLSDMFHMVKNNEDFAEITMIREIVHTHIAIRDTRCYPVQCDPDIDAFFAALHQIGYQGTMSIEGKTEHMQEDSIRSLNTLRSYK
ncbi:sugar phosphate isomerase/epimerase [Sphaerochaeta pleomorpha str. Grapes]|uniref:Sugar phosphate isomerase/epimerase n=1 Tax=Sphaerochaeta pleomorpha (strain ATCC BAA-1885 / DSM 22778 / Grapes) TaxID=158190 RepID=G8QXM8_SPHPG|nr:sugar phosphate isomerase/epimerase family protein [Sphaerochaeta pleomorpha]AEV29591.1 sugar phosphate isomerase/epimerase [Sphaerochaeta pleomorpha str. Grapes]